MLCCYKHVLLRTTAVIRYVRSDGATIALTRKGPTLLHLMQHRWLAQRVYSPTDQWTMGSETCMLNSCVYSQQQCGDTSPTGTNQPTGNIHGPLISYRQLWWEAIPIIWAMSTTQGGLYLLSGACQLRKGGYAYYLGHVNCAREAIPIIWAMSTTQGRLYILNRSCQTTQGRLYLLSGSCQTTQGRLFLLNGSCQTTQRQRLHMSVVDSVRLTIDSWIVGIPNPNFDINDQRIHRHETENTGCSARQMDVTCRWEWLGHRQIPILKLARYVGHELNKTWYKMGVFSFSINVSFNKEFLCYYICR